jgi:hypothetical protein
MATTPAELTTLNTAQLAVVSRARSIIDAELRLGYNNQFPVKIRRGIIDFVFKENELVLNTILDEYRASGWEVVSYSSENQGDWFSFYPAQ